MEEAAMTELAGLYNADGARVGAWCDRTGRVQIGSAFYAMERTWLDDPPSFCPTCGAKVVGA